MKNIERTLIVALFVFSMFCLFVVKVKANTVELGQMKKTIGEISSAECREVLNNGNVLEYPDLEKNIQFWTIIYDYKEYFVQKYQTSRSTGMSGNLPIVAYTCYGAQELIPTND